MKILTALIFMLSLVACGAGKKPQPNYQAQPAGTGIKIEQPQKTLNTPVDANSHQQPLVKKAKQKNPVPTNYYPVPHTVY